MKRKPFEELIQDAEFIGQGVFVEMVKTGYRIYDNKNIFKPYSEFEYTTKLITFDEYRAIKSYCQILESLAI